MPTSRYLGNEDGRGGFGALQYESVMSQLEAFNTDPDHPILIVLHHDGDNFGGGSEGYYNGNFQAFVDWASNQPDRFVPTTIQDYLDLFPPDQNDVIHVESGSWAGADNGDPEFKKWLGDPNSDGYSPDRNSWGVVTAAKSFVEHAESVNPDASDTQEAKTFLLNAQASDYWYWDNSIDGIWDTHPTTASNLAIEKVQNVLSGDEADSTPPSLFKPQREPYNPGGFEWEVAQSNEFEVWTYAFDVGGVQSVLLKYRAFGEPFSQRTRTFNQINEADTSWKTLIMEGIPIESNTNVAPLFKADEYSTKITGINNAYVEYYVEAFDESGNKAQSLIQYVWVGENNSTGGNGGNNGGSTGNEMVQISPENPTKEDTLTIRISDVTQTAKLHWGVNNVGSNWVTPNQVYWPENSELFDGSGPAVESPFEQINDSTLSIKIGPFDKPEQAVDRVNFVIHYGDDSWDNNNGNDYLIDFGTQSGGSDDSHNFVMDGNLDGGVTEIMSENGLSLYAEWDDPYLYLATESASNGSEDKFIFVAENQGELVASPWAKAGQVAEWGAFLANEQSNNYNSWFDQSSDTESMAGNYLEGVININSEFSEIPDNLYLALGTYQNDDGGSLVAQLPSGNGDENIDPEELMEYNYTLLSTENTSVLPDEFRLMQNYPNPFNPSTEIVYQIAESGQIRLTVFDVLGREVAVLVNTKQASGLYSATFDASGLSSGIYFYQLKSGNTLIETKKMMLLK